MFCVEIKSIPCTEELSLKKEAKFLHLFKLISKTGAVDSFPIKICQAFLSKVGAVISSLLSTILKFVTFFPF